MNLGEFRAANRLGYFVGKPGTSREKILRFLTVLGTPWLRAKAEQINIALRGLGHHDCGWSVKRHAPAINLGSTTVARQSAGRLGALLEAPVALWFPLSTADAFCL